MNVIKSYIVTNAAASQGGGGSGSVTSFSAGNLSPLFTTSVATATTTPALTFALVNQNANLVYAGPSTGAAAAPTFRALVAADLPSDSGAYWKTAGTSNLTLATTIDMGNTPLQITVPDTGAGGVSLSGGFGSSPVGKFISVGLSAVFNAESIAFEIGMDATDTFLVADFTDNRNSPVGIQYGAAGYVTTDRSLTDRGYVLGAKTYTGTQTFLSSGLELNNPANTFQYILAGAAIGADRTVTMPLLLGNDIFVTEAFTQTLTNKTIDGSNNTISNISLTGSVTGILPPTNGGTGVANNAASTITISGNFATTFTVTATTGVTLPTTGTLATLAGAESLTNKKLGSLTTNGFVKVGSGDGTLSSTPDLTTTLSAANTITLSGTNTMTFTGGRVFFTPDATNAGINTGTVAGNPSARQNADLWYNTSTGSLNTGKLNATHSVITSGSLTSTANQIPFITGTANTVTYSANLTFVTNRLIGTTLYLTLSAGTATAGTAPLVMTSGTNLTAAISGAVEYNNTFHMTNSDATRRHVVLAPNTTKVTAGAPYANDGYLVMNVGGTDFRIMTTA